jgi:hypothetical protein
MSVPSYRHILCAESNTSTLLPSSTARSRISSDASHRADTLGPLLSFELISFRKIDRPPGLYQDPRVAQPRDLLKGKCSMYGDHISKCEGSYL